MSSNRLKGIVVNVVFVISILTALTFGAITMRNAIDQSRVKLSPKLNRVLTEEIRKLGEEQEKSVYLKVSK